ncbi:MAG TPA: hypothetical protein VGK10_07380 [Prolixibacteraceae bacterium]|jgi:hypothetical protein
MKKNWGRKIIGGLSFTSAMFVFQACYGTNQDFGLDLHLEGQVKSVSTGLPIKGIKVSVADNMQYDLTNEEGKFSIYTERLENLKIVFEDNDLTKDGAFLKKDTILATTAEKVFLDIQMQEK